MLVLNSLPCNGFILLLKSVHKVVEILLRDIIANKSKN